mgnify:CR=1 FL=1
MIHAGFKMKPHKDNFGIQKAFIIMYSQVNHEESIVLYSAVIQVEFMRLYSENVHMWNSWRAHTNDQ